MNTKQLMELGLTQEQADKIFALHGADIESLKAKNAALQASDEAKQAQIAEANATIEGFKKLDVDGIKAAADEWKSKYEQAAAESAKQLSALKFDHALESALTSAKAKNAKAVKALLQPDALKLQEDGSIMGLKEQLEAIKSESDYLFESDVVTPKIVAGGGNKPIENQDAVIVAARKAAGLPTQ